MSGTSESLREALIAFRQVELPPISDALNQVTVTSKVTVTWFKHAEKLTQTHNQKYNRPTTITIY